MNVRGKSARLRPALDKQALKPTLGYEGKHNETT